MVDANPDAYKLVVVALFARNDVAVVEASVEDAVDMNPFRKAIVVEVACSPVARVVKGYAKLAPPAPEASLPSHRSAEPVMVVQKSDHWSPVTPLNVRVSPTLSCEVEAIPETYREVVVACWARRVETVVEARVDEALERKPPINCITVVVA